jgi:crossover junction endodeoxyribonuclease RuvC
VGGHAHGGVASTTRGESATNVERVFVLGIDPGVSRCGYGGVEGGPGRPRPVAVAVGVITTPPSRPLPERLAMLLADLRSLVADLRPDVVAVERLFFQANARTAMSVGQASGLALAVAATAGCDVAQYTPNEVKQAVAGYGAAPKEQVQRMVQSLLGLPERPRPPDAADALALALCHLAVAPFQARVAEAGR